MHTDIGLFLGVARLTGSGRHVDWVTSTPPERSGTVGEASGASRIPGLVIMAFITSLAVVFLSSVVSSIIFFMLVEDIGGVGIQGAVAFGALGLAFVVGAVAFNVVAIRMVDRHPGTKGRGLAIAGFSLAVLAGLILVATIMFGTIEMLIMAS